MSSCSNLWASSPSRQRTSSWARRALSLAESGAYRDSDFTWPADPQGRNLGAGYLKLRPDDLAALGLAYLSGRRSADGDHVIPEAWIKASTSERVVVDDRTGYGYLWWTLRADGSPAYAAMGFGGQLIEVVPDRRLVVVIASEQDPLDAEWYLHTVDTDALTEFVSIWIAPHFGLG